MVDRLPGAPFRRDWIGNAIQSIATAAMILLGILAWGQHVEGEIADIRETAVMLRTRVKADEQNATINANASLALSAKLDALSSQMATISAQLDDLRHEMKR
jgi:hypothetical protein